MREDRLSRVMPDGRAEGEAIGAAVETRSNGTSPTSSRRTDPPHADGDSSKA
jgi:hypothetical protein